MGPTIPTYREKISDWEDEYTDYYRALRHERQLAFEDLVKHVNIHSMAGGARNHHTPELAYLVSICVGQSRFFRITTLIENVAFAEFVREEHSRIVLEGIRKAVC